MAVPKGRQRVTLRLETRELDAIDALAEAQYLDRYDLLRKWISEGRARETRALARRLRSGQARETPRPR